MKLPIVTGLLLCALAQPGLAASKKGIRFWNLTGETLTEVALAPAGTTDFGPNQCKNDKDGTVEFDEDVAVYGVTPGTYDLRLKDDKGRTCYARAVQVKADQTFSVKDNELTGCAK